MSRHRFFSFLMKLLHDQLPTAKSVKRQKPDLYQSLRCPSCSGDEIENLEHLSTCDAYDVAWNTVFKDTQIKMREILNKLCDQEKVSSWQIDNAITKII